MSEQIELSGQGQDDIGSFRHALESIINRSSKENGSNTPDFILAKYLEACLENFDIAVNARSNWYNQATKEYQ